jgi:hypothetical protein
MPLGVVGLPALLAVFTGLGALASVATWGAGPWRTLGLGDDARAVRMAARLGVHRLSVERVRLCAHRERGRMQAASLVGVEGLTALAVFARGRAGVLFDPPTAAARASPSPARARPDRGAARLRGMAAHPGERGDRRGRAPAHRAAETSARPSAATRPATSTCSSAISG